MASAVGIIGAVAGVASTGSSLFSMFSGNSSSNAAKQAAKESAEKQSQASALNIARLIIEGQRAQAESAMEREWNAFESEDAAQWIESWTPVEVSYTKTAANLEKQTLYSEAAATVEGNAVTMGNAVDMAVTMASGIRKDAVNKGELANLAATAKARLATSEGESSARNTARERDYAMEQLGQETRAKDNELRAAMAARGQAETGSALDVLTANQDLALKKQGYLASKAAQAVTDARYQSGMEASLVLQSGHMAAWDTLSDALRSSTKYLREGEATVEETTVKTNALNRVLAAKTTELDTATDYKAGSLELLGERKADITRREGWREDYLAEREAQNTLWKLQYSMMDEAFNVMSGGTVSSSGTDWGSIMQDVGGVAKGISTIYSSGRDAGWWGSSGGGSTGGTGGSLLDFGSTFSESAGSSFDFGGNVGASF